MPNGIRDEMRVDYMYKGKYLLQAYGKGEQLLTIAENPEVLADFLHMNVSSVYRRLKVMNEGGVTCLHTREYGRVAVVRVEAFAEDIGDCLYSVLMGWDYYVKYIKLYTYDHPYPLDTKWVYYGEIGKAPDIYLDWIVTRMTYADRTLRIWIRKQKERLSQ